MGNYASCALARIPSSSSDAAKTSAAKVIFPGGEIRSYTTPISAAELMLESPYCFLVTSQSLRPGRRLSPLPADEELDVTGGGGVYVVLPMNRLNSTVTPADMGKVYLAVNGNSSNKNRGKNHKKKRSSEGKVRVVPAAEEEEEVRTAGGGRLNLDEIEGLHCLPAEFQHRMSVSHRSKKPVLETIVEEDTPVSKHRISVRR